MKEQNRRTTTEVLLHQVAVVRVVETQVEEIKTEGALVEVAHQAAAAQQEVAVRPRRNPDRQRPRPGRGRQ